ncbi:MAG: PhzF family phenazine biosynthesis protein [Paracoccaceae bacterium]
MSADGERPGRRVVWVDAFTDAAFAGNPCAVVFDADAVPVETRLAFTRETGLVECAFLVDSDRADFGARYYMPHREIPMAGHPTVATAAALDHAGLLAGRERFTLELGGGVFEIGVDRSGPRTVYAMRQNAPSFGRAYEPGEIAALLGLEAAEVLGTPRTVSTGNRFCVVRLRDHDALARVRLDVERLRAMPEREEGFWEPFAFVAEGYTEAGDTAARLLLAPPEPPEDPFTGSATGAMAAYAYAEGLVGPRFTAEQGHAMGRPGRARVALIGPPDAIEGVVVAGPGVVVMDGRVFLD